jgi:small conductance mechanosensitive channel
MNLRRTVLRDLDGVVHFIPHSGVTTASNFTRGYSRVNLNVVVPYDADIDQAFEIIDRVGEVLASDPSFGPLITDPPRALRVEDLGAAGVSIKVMGETAPMEQWSVAGELRRRLIRSLGEAGITLKLG